MAPSMIIRMIAIAAIAALGWSSASQAQEPASSQKPGPEMQARYDQLAKVLSGSKFAGRFTVSGAEDEPLTKEEYHILECRKLDEGNLWMITARIKYGNKDVTVPLPVPIEWAGSTPVIAMNDFVVPLMGTFDAAVVLDLDQRKYAGTWSHDDVGGHLFGDIVPGKAESSPESKSPGSDQ